MLSTEKPTIMSDTDKLVGPPPAYSATQQQDSPPPYTPSDSAAAPTYQYQSFDSVVSNQVDLVNVIRLGPTPVLVQCPSCGQFEITRVSYKPGALTILSAIICFFCCIICTFLPFCITELQDVCHHCPNCGHHIGTYARL